MSDLKVSKSLGGGDGDDDFDKYLQGHYNGTLLKAMIIEQEKIKLVEPHSKERIEECKVSGNGRGTLITDDLFIAAWKNESEKEIAELEKVKRGQLAAMKIQQAASEIMQQKPNKIQELNFSSLTVVELDTLLCWYILYSTKMTKQEKVAKLTESYNQSNLLPVRTKEWTTENEGKLQQLKGSDVELVDMALGRKKALMQLQFQAAGVDMPRRQI